MPQGVLKSKTSGLKSKAGSKTAAAAHTQKQRQKAGTKTGSRVAKSKDVARAQRREMTRKQAAGITVRIEQSLAEKAGHVEMLGNKSKGKGKSTDKKKEGDKRK